MTPEEIAALAAPLSEEQPCGPDLEALGDAEYAQFFVHISAVLPTSFASFRRDEIKFPEEFATLSKLLARSRDLRLLVPLANLLILNRDLKAYTAVFKLIEKLLEEAWPSLHPGLTDGDATWRKFTLLELDDRPYSVFPLEAVPLFNTRRFGPVSCRSHLLASGAVQPRASQVEGEKDETAPSTSDLSQAVVDADLPALVEARALALGLKDALAHIEALADEKPGMSGAVRFKNLAKVVSPMVAFLEGAVSQRDPTLALVAPATDGAADKTAGQQEAGPGATGAVRTIAQVEDALAAAAGYFTRSEPSSPILMLIGQAQALIGQNFYEAMLVLLPEESKQAGLRVGREPGFALSLESLAKLTVKTAAESEEHPNSAEETEEPQSPPAPVAEDNVNANATEDSNSGVTESGDVAEATPPALPVPPPPAPAPLAPPSGFRAADRRAAMGLLHDVAAYFRHAEPSSPIPLLLDRAQGIVGKDFAAILREILPSREP